MSATFTNGTHSENAKPQGKVTLPKRVPLNPVGIFLGTIGALICLGSITLTGESHSMSMLIGLACLLVTQSGLLRFTVEVPTPTKEALPVWGCLAAVWATVILVATVRALVVLLGWS